jgi:hypothetical protein
MLKYGEEREPRLLRSLQRHALLRILRLQAVPVVEHAGNEVARHVDEVELVAVERKQPRVRLLDHGNFHATDLRQALALHGGVGRLRFGVRVARQRRKGLLAIVRIRLEHDALRAPPFLEPVGAGAHGIGHRPAARVAVRLDDFARDRRELRRGQARQEGVVGLDQLELQRVAVGCAHALDVLVVIELARAFRFLERLVEAREAVAHEECVRRADLRIDEPLDRVHEIVRGQLALLSLEDGVVGEIDALLHLDGPGEPVR